jgi:hypothetical protein
MDMFFLFVFSFGLGLIAGIFWMVLCSQKFFLDYIAKQFYFDSRYYVTTYPELKDKNLFSHYDTLGWKENKNPNKNFDTQYYCAAYKNKLKKYLNPLSDYVRSLISLENIFHTKRFIHYPVVKALENPRYYLVAVSIFQNEARFLKEWIEFHLMMGVEHFYLYNHLSTDHYMDVLQPYIEKKLVTLKNINEVVRNNGWYRVQTATFFEACKINSPLAEWIMTIDSDEYWFPLKEQNLVSVLKQYDHYAALSINWQFFGSSNVKKLSTNELLIERLNKTTSDLKGKLEASKKEVKTFSKPRYVVNFTCPHYSDLRKGFLQVDENFNYFLGYDSPTISKNILRINHYFARDWEFFIKQKLKRFQMEDPLWTEVIQINKNMDEYDDAILRFVPELRKRMGLDKENQTLESKQNKKIS